MGEESVEKLKRLAAKHAVDVVQSGEAKTAEIFVMIEAEVGDTFAIRAYLSGAAAGTAEWVLDGGIVEFLAV